ncbi:MAG: TonB-dependent siderophore receptor [Xanthobacteraceae bacterium]|nr:TonB-dependent siderophore receptor [Xanthobacteraceae bacterium]
MRFAPAIRIMSAASILAGADLVARQGSAIAQVEVTELPRIVVRPPTRRVQDETRHAQPGSSRPSPPNGGSQPTATTAGTVIGYRALTAISATKTITPIERIPQTVQVIPRSVIDDQAPLTQSEALRNVAATTGMPGIFLYGANYKVRGFDAERYVDGLPNYIDGGDYTSVVNTERIEVVKGPGGLFFQSGLGVTGGVINTISKLPVAAPFHHAGLVAGGYAVRNPWFDINRPLQRGVLFRMTGEFEKSRDYVDLIERRRYSFNPTLTFTNGETTSLTVQGRVSHRDHQVYVGLPATGTLDRSRFTLRRDLFVGPPDVPKGFSDNAGVTIRFDHALDSVWSFNAAARYSGTRQSDPAQTYLSHTPTFGTSYAMFNLGAPWHAREFSASSNVTAKFAVGDTSNTLLLGGDYDRVADNLSIWSSFAGMTNLANPFPAFPRYVDPIGSGARVFDANNINVNSGLTAQLQTTVWDRLHLLSGLRWADVDLQGSRQFGGGQNNIDEAALLPRFGVAFDVARGVTPFAGYSEGLRTVRWFAGEGAPKPEEAKQLEAGVKLALRDGLAATLAVFDITRRNVVSTDPANPFWQVQTGEQRSRGFDAALTWHPVSGLSVLASYAYIDARITQDTVLPVGNRPDRVPAHSGRLWGNYKVQSGPFKNVSIGAGLYAASSQALALDNRYFTPGFITFDAKVGYDAGQWAVALVGKNLANRDYFIPYRYAQGRVAPAEPLTILAVATLRSGFVQ